MKLIFIRHGQTNYNLKDLCNGRPSPKVRLTPLGIKQAKAAARKLKNERIEVVYVSQLIRSQQTGLILNGFHNVPTKIDGRLNDRSMGQFEDKPATLFYEWRDRQKSRWKCKPRGGESYEEMKARVAAFIKDLARTDYKTVLIVSHLPVLKVVRGYFMKLSNTEMDKLTERHIPNCKIMVFHIKKKRS